MRAAVAIDDALYEQALELADPDLDKAYIIREALKTFVPLQGTKRLSALGGCMPHMHDVLRRDVDLRPQ